ncbi:MAG: germination protein YpeB [Patescibacteria group bacterium]
MRIRERLLWPFLGLAILLVGAWGFSQYSARRLWENRVETQYQRAFNDLTQNLGGLETQLAKASVSGTPRFLRSTLAEIWRLAYAAQEKLGLLPLGAVELTRMKMLLAKVGAFSYRVTDRPAEEIRLTDQEWNTLQGLRSQARYVSGQLTSMQTNIIQNNLRWVDVDRLGRGTRLTAAALARRVGVNKVTKSLVMVENGLRRMPEPGFPESEVIFPYKPKGLTGAKITPAAGRRIASTFAGGGEARYLGRTRGDFPTFIYSVAKGGKAGAAAPTRISVTEKGGHVAWMLSERILGPRRINLARATAAARDFAEKKGLRDMAVVSREEFGAVDVITMVPCVDGVWYYPEMVKISVAMDDGRVVGYEGVPYLTFHDPARRPQPARLTEEDARRRVNPRLVVRGVRRAVTLGQKNKEVMAYEVDGTMKGERFLVYIDAADGSEVKIRRVDANGVEID